MGEDGGAFTSLVFRKIGDGRLVRIDEDRERQHNLQWARLLVRVGDW